MEFKVSLSYNGIFCLKTIKKETGEKAQGSSTHTPLAEDLKLVTTPILVIHNLTEGSDFLFWLLKGAELGLPHTCTPPILKPTQIPQKSTNCLSTESETKANKHKQPMNPESFNNQRDLLVQSRKLSFLISQLSL